MEGLTEEWTHQKDCVFMKSEARQGRNTADYKRNQLYFPTLSH